MRLDIEGIVILKRVFISKSKCYALCKSTPFLRKYHIREGYHRMGITYRVSLEKALSVYSVPLAQTICYRWMCFTNVCRV